MTISDIIRQAGGIRAISAASAGTSKPITVWAIHKWRKKGIPDDHWPVLINLSAGKLTVMDLYTANRRLKSVGPLEDGERVAAA